MRSFSRWLVPLLLLFAVMLAVPPAAHAAVTMFQHAITTAPGEHLSLALATAPIALTSVRAKFSCSSVEEFTHSSVAKFGAIHSSKGENADFADATPSGQLQITISKGRPAAEFFEPGKSYYLDFSEAPPA